MRKIIICVIALLASAGNAFSQYYDWGQEPDSIKWRTIKGVNTRFVFPRYFQDNAVKTMHYMDAAAPYIGYGFRHGPMSLPVVFHTQNFQSNGLVMLAPGRMEYITTPPAGQFAMPWMKQLSVHEYRHAVHFNNARQNVFKYLGWVLGQQGQLVGSAFFPYWLMEGDAVLAETQMSTYGRGVQPSFTIEYRALALENDRRYSSDKYFSGSYKDYMPDHYQLGYQLASFAYTKYGENIWDKVVDFSTRRPYYILSNKVALNRFYQTSVNKLFRETMIDINEFWRGLPLETNTAEIIVPEPKSYTTYASPVWINDKTAAVIKEDMDRHSAIYLVNTETGEEKKLKNVGNVNTGLSYGDGCLYWTEYRPSLFWEQRVNSVICRYDLFAGKKEFNGEYKTLGVSTSAMFPIIAGGELSYVEYDPSGSYTIVAGDNRIELPEIISVHGLGYGYGHKFYIIGMTDDGMGIMSVSKADGSIENIIAPAFITLANLRVSGKNIYYNSIGSGKDEVHMVDITGNSENRITTSTYGSFMPSAENNYSDILMSVYTPKGYLLATQNIFQPSEENLRRRSVPENKINPDRIKWDVPNIDKVVAGDTTSLPVKKYRKGLHLFRVHSWAPVNFDPERIVDESSFNVHVGATVLAQNLLNSVFTTLGYKYTEEGSFFNAAVKFYKWAPKFELEVEYGTMDQLFYGFDRDKNSIGYKNYFGVLGRMFMPFTFSNGYWTHRLTPYIEFEHENSIIPYVDSYDGQGRVETYHYRTGYQKINSYILYTTNVKTAYRDFLPKWGFAARISNTSNPFMNNSGSLWTGYGRILTPGILAHHSLMLRGAVQKHSNGMFLWRQKEIYPRGADYNVRPLRYMASSADYQFPVWYPDGGIESIVYFKRVRVNLHGDYARLRTRYRDWYNLTSYGCDLILDIVPVRLPSSSVSTVTLSVSKPSDHKGVVFGVGATLPL